MPPRRNNQLPPPVEPDLPPLNEFDAPMIPGEEPIYADDLYGAGIPADVAEDVAQMPLPETGVGFDFNSLNVQTREDFDALPSEQQELLKAMKRGVQFTPESAAQFITSQMTRRMEAESKTQVQSSDPVRQAQQKRLEAESSSMETQRVQRKQATLDTIGSMRSTINDVLTHPGFSGSVGAKNQAYLFGLKSEPIAGTKEADFKALLDQVQGGAFLQAFESLKGGGQITQIEGEKATQAIVRAQQSQSEEGFKKSMNDFMSVLDRAEKRATSGETAQQPSAPAATAAAPRPTKTISGIMWEKGDDGKWYKKR
jgi:hypothetical protein